MSRKDRDRSDDIISNIEQLTNYLLDLSIGGSLLVGVKELLCNMIQGGSKHGQTLVDTPRGQLLVSVKERPGAALPANSRYYDVELTLPNNITVPGYAVMRKISTPYFDMWVLTEARLLHFRYPGFAIELTPCIAEEGGCPVSAWWLVPFLLFVIWPSIIQPFFSPFDIVMSATNIYITILALAVVSAVVCKSTMLAVRNSILGVIGSPLLALMYLALYRELGGSRGLPPIFALLPPDVAWIAYFISLALLYGPAIYFVVVRR